MRGNFFEYIDAGLPCLILIVASNQIFALMADSKLSDIFGHAQPRRQVLQVLRRSCIVKLTPLLRRSLATIRVQSPINLPVTRQGNTKSLVLRGCAVITARMSAVI